MTKTTVTTALLLGLTATATISLGARADNLAGKCDTFLTRSESSHAHSGTIRVIARIEGDLTPARVRQLKAAGADIYRRLPIIDSVAVSLPARNLRRLAAMAFVRHLSTDFSVKKTDAFTVTNSGAAAAWQQYPGLDGTGVTVAVLDSGVAVHQDLNNKAQTASRVIASTSFIAGSGDPCGHGTHVAGIIAGNAYLSTTQSTGPKYTKTFSGVAPNANIVSVQVLNAQGVGTVSDVVAGIGWIQSNKPKYNIRVMSISLGHPVGDTYKNDPLCQAVEKAWKVGIVVVCAAGNDGRANTVQSGGATNEGWGTAYGSIESPGNDPYVITVGAMKAGSTRTGDKIATYSSRGPSRTDLVLKPDIVAPGNRVISTLANNSYVDANYAKTNEVLYNQYVQGTPANQTPYYFVLSGTSMATPVVSGAAALILQKYPTLSPDTVKARLMMGADKWADPSGNTDPCTYGAGYLNIPAALICTAVTGQSALSPTVSQDTSGNVYINLDSSIWGSRAIWGTGVNDLRAVWGTRAIWGTSTNILSGSRAVWGTSVWNDRAIWGTSLSQADLSTNVINGEQ